MSFGVALAQTVSSYPQPKEGEMVRLIKGMTDEVRQDIIDFVCGAKSEPLATLFWGLLLCVFVMITMLLTIIVSPFLVIW